MVKGPRDRDLPRRTAIAFPAVPQAFHEGEVLRERWFPELDVTTAPIALGKCCRSLPRHRAGQQARGHRRIDDRPNGIRTAIRKDLLFDLATNQRIRRLQRGDRSYPVCAT